MRLYISSILASVAVADLHRGTNPRNQHLYNPVSNSKFKCIKSGELIDITSLNDDYCDCADGSDEPGTSACAHLSKKPNTFVGFWCRNAGFKEQTISPMIVDDGICDCCDGTDEVLKKCENTCDQVGAIDREKRAAETAMHAEGIALKKKWVEDGKKAHNERIAEIVEIEADMAELEKKAVELKAEKDRVCEIEKVEKQRCLDADKLKQDIIKKEKRDNAVRNAYRQLDLNGDGVLTADEVLTFDELKPASEDSTGDSSDDSNDDSKDDSTDESNDAKEEKPLLLADFTLEQAKQLLDGESTNTESFSSVTWDLISEHFDEDGWLPGNEPTEPPTLPPQEEQIEEISNEIDDESDNIPDPEEDFADEFDSDDDDFDEDEDEEEDKSWKDDDRNYDDYEAKRLKDEVFDEAAHTAIKAANTARNEHTKQEQLVKAKKSKLTVLRKTHDQDFGLHKEYFQLYSTNADDNCIELRTNEYIYKMCGYRKASQKPVNGGMETNLGTFEDWVGNDYNKQRYSGGQKCWNGPDRSCNVIFSCGKENKLLEANEPQRCEYEFLIETPAACDDFRHDEL